MQMNKQNMSKTDHFGAPFQLTFAENVKISQLFGRQDLSCLNI